MFELAQLRSFVAVAEELHFGRAAERLHMTQPPLSRQIQLLEHALGTLLFERTSRSVRLTATGRSLLPEASRILQLAEATAQDIRLVDRGEAGTLRLGFTGGSGYSFLPRLAKRVMTELPRVALVLREMRSAQQIEALEAGRLDAGLLRLPADRRAIELVRVMRDPLVLALPADHPLARRDAPPALDDVHGLPLITFSPTENGFLHDLVATLLRMADVDPRIVLHVNQIHTALGLAGAGVGAAIVPHSVACLGIVGIVLRPFEPAPSLAAELYLAWRRDAESPALNRFRRDILPAMMADGL